MQPAMKFTLQVTASIVISLAIIPAVKGRELCSPGKLRPGPMNFSVQTRGQSPRGAIDPDRHRVESERDLETRIWNLRMLSEQARKPGRKRPNTQQALAQLQKDFTRLQMLNRNLGRAAIGSSALDPKFVSKSVSEIKKRAERLNANLALPEPEASSEQPTTDSIASPKELKSAVLGLVKLVFRFVDNPFFKEASVVDTQLTTKARRDLEDIIKLSERLRRDTEKLDQTSRESPDKQ